jgi:hypothetical protein
VIGTGEADSFGYAQTAIRYPAGRRAEAETVERWLVGDRTKLRRVAATFDDVEALASACRFNDCRHASEPGCAVQAAVADGQLAPQRLDAWRALLREAEVAARRADPQARRAYERRFSRVAKEAVRRKRGDH